MKKNIFIISIFLMVSVLLCACSHSPDNVSYKPLNEYLITKSIELTCTMGSLARSEEYIMLISQNSELTDLIAELGTDEYKAPNKAVLIRVPDDTMNSIVENTVGKLSLPNDAYETVIARMYSSVPNIINAQQGTNILAVTSMLFVGKAFQQHKDFSDNTYVVLVYDNYSSITVFIKSAEGITSTSTTFLFLTDDMKNAVNEEAATDYLSEILNISEIEIEYINGSIIADYK